MSLFRRAPTSSGVTSVVISHDMASTFRIGDRISMLFEGRMIVSGTRDEVRASPDPRLRAFVEPAGISLGPAPT